MTTNKVPDEVSAPVRPVALVVDDVHVQYDAMKETKKKGKLVARRASWDFYRMRTS